MDTLYLNNSHLLQLSRLKDARGQLIRNANTVEATLLTTDETEVSGMTWPVPLAWMPDREVYEAQLSANLQVEDGKRYLLKIVAEDGVSRYEATRYVDVERRFA